MYRVVTWQKEVEIPGKSVAEIVVKAVFGKAQAIIPGLTEGSGEGRGLVRTKLNQ